MHRLDRDSSELAQGVYTPFQQQLLRAEKLTDGRGRGLASGRSVQARSTICAAQPPLSLLQYSDSRSLCEVCCVCRRFCGSAGSALSKVLQAADMGSLQDYLPDPQLAAELDAPPWRVRDRVSCEHCDVVFCSEECAERGRTEGWHRVLCTDLSPQQRQVWKCFKQYSAKYHEQFTAAAQVIAEVISLVKYSDVELWEAMAYFSRFMKMSWLNMQNLPSLSMCQAGPVRGKLAAIAQGRKQQRQQVMLASLELLVAILWEERWSELLSLDYYSNLVGQFCLSNVWVQIEHPLNERFQEICENEEFSQKYGGLLRACQEALQKVKAASSDDDGADQPENPETTAVHKEAASEPFALPRFEGSALYPCVALSNHSCMPNFTMRYHDGCLADMVALRDIKEGEELNLAYVSPSTPLPERVASLWKSWGFVCTCRRCQDEVMMRAVQAREERADGYPPELGVQLSAAGIAAAMELVRGKHAEEEEDDDEETENGSSDEESSEEDAGVSNARNSPFSGPFGKTALPDSVKGIEAAMRDMMADMADEIDG
ncbi:unnamed protein product [Effrenium voratum]|uniref:SET domain-containing protein n=1 Tax=Effrenium voratum TaxID=2562239 RepID=A0AA36HQ18_9DINO|nr:unnamed protein product [Effrenium voratum]